MTTHPAVNRRWLPLWLLLVLTLSGDSLAGAANATTAGHPGETNTHRGPTQASVLAARATATTEFGLLAGGDYAGAWRLWTPQAQRSLSLAEYLRRASRCTGGLGQPATLTQVRQDDATTVTVSWTRAGRGGVSRLRYLSGRWRFEPGEADQHPCRANG